MIFKVEYNVFGHRVHISTNSSILFSRINDIVVDVVDESPILNEIHINFTIEEDHLLIKHNGDIVYYGDDPDELTLQLDLFISHLLIKNTKQVIRLHGGCAEVNGRTLIITGDKTSGKTTLLLNLMLNGDTVFNDENLIFNDLNALPFPRKFHLKDGTLKLLPNLLNYAKHLRKYPYHLGGHFRFFAPTDANRTWVIKKTIPNKIIFLEPEFGGESKMEQSSKIDMLEKLFFQTTNFGEHTEKQISILTKLVNHCECYTLHFGDVNMGTQLIYGLTKESISI